jgi:hypothetical protein
MARSRLRYHAALLLAGHLASSAAAATTVETSATHAGSDNGNGFGCASGRCPGQTAATPPVATPPTPPAETPAGPVPAIDGKLQLARFPGVGAIDHARRPVLDPSALRPRGKGKAERKSTKPEHARREAPDRSTAPPPTKPATAESKPQQSKPTKVAFGRCEAWRSCWSESRQIGSSHHWIRGAIGTNKCGTRPDGC